MSNQPQAFVATPLRGGNSHTLQNSHSAEFRTRPPPAPISPTGASNGHPPVPVPNARMGNGNQDSARQAFPGPRSPPNAKSEQLRILPILPILPVRLAMRLTLLDTSHVPCKFYRQGACQAGKACPFLHSDAIEPCKYYRKVSSATPVTFALNIERN